MLPFRLNRLRPLHTYLSTVSSELCHSRFPPLVARHASYSARRRARQKPGPKVELLPALSPEERAEWNEKHQSVDDQIKVNFFEQDEHGDIGTYDRGPQAKRRRVEDDSYMEELAADEESFDRDLEELEDDVEGFRLPTDVKDDPLQNVFSTEDRAAGTAALLRNLGGGGGGFPHRIDLPEDIEESSEVFLEKFNQCLDEASLDPGNDKARKDLWRWYERSKIYIPGFLGMLPGAAWELLWISQSEDSEANTSRASHLRVLSADMVKVGRQIDPEKRLGRLEGLFMDGKQEQALQEWERAREAGDAGNPSFLELGIRMYTKAGQLSRAEELVDVLFKLHSTSNPRIVSQLISASINTHTHDGAERGWRLYGQMRQRLGNDMTMQDFDEVSMDFLRNKRTDYALAVFRDMMILGDTRELQKPKVQGRVRARYSSLMKRANDAKQATDLSLHMMEYMPRRFQNKFFYAKWLKKLIGMGELDSAAQVIELMYERGVRPDARHLNGIIGAWLRQENTANKRKAEELAWAMIQQRLDQVRQRKLERNPRIESPATSVSDGADVVIPLYKERPLPAATIETFCTLLAYYVEESSEQYIHHLRQTLNKAEIPMNSAFLNQLLYHYFRVGGHREAYRRFVVLTRTDRGPIDPSRPVMPDVETWITLWELMKTDLLEARDVIDYLNHPERRFPTPRQLFAQMHAWSLALRGQAQSQALADMEDDTYNDIIRTFLMARDLPGAFVVMRMLTSDLDVWPSGKTARMLLLQISMHNTHRGRRHRRGMLKPGTADMDDKMSRTSSVLSLVTEHRQNALQAETGVDFEELDEDGQAEESLRTLMQFLYTIIKRQDAASEAVSAADQIKKAAEEMGVEGFDVEESLELYRAPEDEDESNIDNVNSA